jgi:hypothetical protein
MFALFAPLLGRWMSQRIAGLVSGLIVGGLLCGALWGAYCWSWDRGRDHERAAWEARVKEVREKRQETAAAAAKTDVETATQSSAAITEKRKEIDNATANLPDQGLTPRQRARACAELRRQGRGC